jgi:phage tail protein X
VTEAVLAANPGLAGKGLILPLGTVITMPEIARPTTQRPLISLWD